MPGLEGGRWLLTLAMFLGYVVVYCQRSHLAVTVVAMLNATFVVHHQHRQHHHHQQVPVVNVTRRRADCRPFPRRDDDVSAARSAAPAHLVEGGPSLDPL